MSNLNTITFDPVTTIVYPQNIVVPTSSCVFGGSIVGTSYRVTQSYTNTQTDSYTISNSDNGKLVQVNSGSVVTITLTTSSIDPGWSAMYYQSGGAPILFTTASTAVVMRSRGNHSGSAGQYSLCSILRTSNGDFILAGDCS